MNDRSEPRNFHPMRNDAVASTSINQYALVLLVAGMVWSLGSGSAWAQSKYATSDSQSGYVHWIELYDENNNKIDPIENPKPYSPEKTCGRCHDFKTIAHGWHFNAALSKPNSDAGRPGIPMIWSDPRTGTHLPVSYRGWEGTYHPNDLGISPWQMAAKFGGYLPGMKTDAGSSGSATAAQSNNSGGSADSVESDANRSSSNDRTAITGALPIDCMLCHFRPGSGYSPFTWTEQIQDQNFAYAPTAALGLAVVTGNLKRLKDSADLESAEVQEQLPSVRYESSKFRSDGKVFVDLIRKPSNESCYYCHTEMSTDVALGARWTHDDDVHLRAGMQCADCHRNGLDHETIRGFEGEQHAAGSIAASFSCRGCHLGETLDSGKSITIKANNQLDNAEASTSSKIVGRMGAPWPAHKGLPPLHFEKLSCTACHSGQTLENEIGRVLTSQAHQLGSHVKRTGQELPAIFGGVMLSIDGQGLPWQPQQPDSIYTPHRMLWPSFWALRKDERIQPLNPDSVYDLLRKPLKIRKDFALEIAEVKLTLSQRKQILGDDKAARMKPEELDEKQRALIEQAEQTERKKQVDEKMLLALTEIETANPGSQAIFISGGLGMIKTAEGKLDYLDQQLLGSAARPYAWPVAHNVRSAQQSLGVNGCQECHAPDSPFFYAGLTPVGLLPDQPVERVSLHELQQADIERLAQWSQMFEGRSAFKIAGWIALGLTLIVTIAAAAVNLSAVWGGHAKSR